MGGQEIRSYRDLRVWQQAMDLAVECYRLTREFPRDELFGLTSQIRRAASSIAANIAEGYGRDSTKAYVNHLRIAQGSLKEVETHLLLSERVGLVSAASISDALARSEAIGKMLGSLIRNVLNTGQTE
jgi:four helix bundle protein